MGSRHVDSVAVTCGLSFAVACGPPRPGIQPGSPALSSVNHWTTGEGFPFSIIEILYQLSALVPPSQPHLSLCWLRSGFLPGFSIHPCLSTHLRASEQLLFSFDLLTTRKRLTSHIRLFPQVPLKKYFHFNRSESFLFAIIYFWVPYCFGDHAFLQCTLLKGK